MGKNSLTRLLFVHDHRFHRGSGGELYTLGSFPRSLWERYLAHFDEVHVIARDGGPLPWGAHLARADREGVSFEFLPSLASLRQLLFRSRDTTLLMRAAVAAADAVVARLPSEIGLLAIRAARQLCKPYAVEVVGCAWDVCLNHGALSARMYAPLAFARMRRAIADAPLALYVTSSWLQQRYPTQGDQWSASNVRLQPFSSEAIVARERRLEALKRGQRPILGTVASLRIRSKGVQTALEALARLRASGLDLTYRVLGPGPTEPWSRLAERFGISDLVHFDGTRSAGEDVCRWLDEIDIHLQPSFQEGLPRATMEAMSRGVACLGSTCGGIPEVIPSERMHRAGDVSGLERLVRKLALDPDQLLAASHADRRTAKQFHPARLHDQRNGFYRRLRAEAERRASIVGRTEL